MVTSSIVIVDANLALSIVLDYPTSNEIQGLWTDWVQNDVEIAAPNLWVYEVTSAIHKLYMLKQLQEASAKTALDAVLSLDVHLVEVDTGLCQLAFSWATRLNQLATYDSFYLALSEKLDAELWTLDRRLSNAALQLGSERVHLVGE